MLMVVLICQFDRRRLRFLLHAEEGLWRLSRMADMRLRGELENLLNNAEMFCKVFVVVGSVLIVSIYVFSLIITGLPLGTHNFQGKTMYYFYLAVQILCTAHILIYGLTMLVMIFCGTIITLIVQYKMVNAAIRGVEVDIAEKNYRQVRRNLADIVEHHLFLRRYWVMRTLVALLHGRLVCFRYTKTLNETFSALLAVTFFSGVTVLCTQVYTALEE